MTTRKTSHPARLLATPLLAAIVSTGGCEDDDPAGPDGEIQQLIATVRTATQPYQSESAATSAGYTPDTPCVTGPGGAMGIHYGKEELVDATVEPSQPEVLLFEPGDGDELTLVAVEFLVMADEWDATNSEPPELVGTVFDDHRAEADRHGVPFPHYELHFWVWRENPEGIFEPFNPDVDCP
jgi:hypothetical protein